MSIIVRENSNKNDTDVKLSNLAKQSYPSDKYEIVTIPECSGISGFTKAVDAANGEIIIISDTKTVYNSDAIQKLAKHFSDKQIGCVVGQLRKVDAEGNEIDGGLFWRYENFVRKQESKLGAVSGANHAIYAFRKEIISYIPHNIIDVDFYISTYILQAGYDVIMDAEAIAYESAKNDRKQQFERHVRDGMGYYQALGVFWRLLLPRKGSFIYISHRVMKWLVPFNMVIAFVTSAILTLSSWVFAVLLGCQVVLYFAMILYHLQLIKKLQKIVALMYYFMTINLAYLIGCFKLFGGAEKRKG